MADDTYMNPFQSNPTGSGPYNGFSNAVESARRNIELAPFKKMELQRQQMGVDKQTQDLQEYTSPEAIQSRTSAYPAATATNQLKQTEAEGKMELHPIQQQQLVEQAKQQLAETQGKPAGMLLEELGNASQHLNMAPQGMRKQLYDGLVKGIESKYPGMKFPDEWREYHPGVEAHLTALHEAATQTPKHAQEMEKGQQAGMFQMEGSRLRGAEAAALRAQIMTELKNSGQLKENPGQELSRIRREMSDPKISPEKKAQLQAEYEMATEPMIEDKIIKRYGNETNALYLSQEKQDKRRAAMDKDRESMRKQYNLPGTPSPSNNGGRVRITKDGGKTFSTVPKEQLEEAKKQGWNEAK